MVFEQYFNTKGFIKDCTLSLLFVMICLQMFLGWFLCLCGQPSEAAVSTCHHYSEGWLSCSHLMHAVLSLHVASVYRVRSCCEVCKFTWIMLTSCLCQNTLNMQPTGKCSTEVLVLLLLLQALWLVL